MDRGFYTILLAQFLSALADNALFIAAIALLKTQGAPEYQHSLLLYFFTVSYVVLSPFAGAFADALPKGKVMLICNGIKFVGCLAMLFGMDPVIAYAIVGFGAAAYSPAKYGIITEYLPHEKLVAANGWLEGSTVSAIILGTVLGGFLVGPSIAALLQGSNLDSLNSLSGPLFGIAITTTLYLLAAWVNLYIPRLNIDHRPPKKNPFFLLRDFTHCVILLWRDPRGRLTLAVTTLFWGAGATMRLVVLNWSTYNLGISFSKATMLIGVVAFGIAFGSFVAGKLIPLHRSFRVLPAGMLMGLMVMGMIFVTDPVLAGVLMFIVGFLAGFFVVPLNAMLQHRGHMLMGAGHSIAVQNFNENLGILLMVGLHAYIVAHYSVDNVPPMTLIILGFGSFVFAVMSIITVAARKRGKELEIKDW